jgi:hypothetical protein
MKRRRSKTNKPNDERPRGRNALTEGDPGKCHGTGSLCASGELRLHYASLILESSTRADLRLGYMSRPTYLVCHWHKERALEHILIVGSAPSAPQAAGWDVSGFDAVVVINNAWQAVPQWTHFIHPEDFPPERRPVVIPAGRVQIGADTYVAAQNKYGGFVYAGGTMAFTAAYWALDAFRPKSVHFFACDMVYPKTGATHFYGTGAADPLRKDPSLVSLPAKARRLQVFAAAQGCCLVNLSPHESVLPYPRGTLDDVENLRVPAQYDAHRARQAAALEQHAGYYVPSGRYWDQIDHFDPNVIAKIDAAWLSAFACGLETSEVAD